MYLQEEFEKFLVTVLLLFFRFIEMIIIGDYFFCSLLIQNDETEKDYIIIFIERSSDKD